MDNEIPQICGTCKYFVDASEPLPCGVNPFVCKNDFCTCNDWEFSNQESIVTLEDYYSIMPLVSGEGYRVQWAGMYLGESQLFWDFRIFVTRKEAVAGAFEAIARYHESGDHGSACPLSQLTLNQALVLKS